MTFCARVLDPQRSKQVFVKLYASYRKNLGKSQTLPKAEMAYNLRGHSYWDDEVIRTPRMSSRAWEDRQSFLEPYVASWKSHCPRSGPGRRYVENTGRASSVTLPDAVASCIRNTTWSIVACWDSGSCCKLRVTFQSPSWFARALSP